MLTEAVLGYTETTVLVNKLDKEIKRVTKHSYAFSAEVLKVTFSPNRKAICMILYDLENKTAGLFASNQEKLYRTDESYSPVVFDLGLYNLVTPAISYTGEKQLISGYPCTKAILSFVVDGYPEKMEVWFTQDYVLQPRQASYIFRELKGLPVKFTFKSRPRMSIGEANRNITCEFLLDGLKEKPGAGDLAVHDAGSYEWIDAAQKNAMLMEILMGSSGRPKSSNRGEAIREAREAVDGSSLSVTKYNPFTIGDTLSAFEGAGVDGKRVSSNDYPGKMLVINFWFTGCAPCMKEMPYLNAVREKYGGRGIAFISITYNTAAEVADFLKKRSFSFDNIVDAQDLIVKYNVSTYPLTLTADRDRVIRFVKVGDVSGDLEKAIGKLAN